MPVKFLTIRIQKFELSTNDSSAENCRGKSNDESEHHAFFSRIFLIGSKEKGEYFKDKYSYVSKFLFK